MRTKILAVILAACTMLTLAVAPASATGGPPDPCKKHECPTPPPPPPPPCGRTCPVPTPPPVQTCYDQEALRIAERYHSPKFVDVAVTIDGTDGEDFVVEYQRNSESSQARVLDGGQLDGPYSGTFTVRAWRDVDGIVRVRVWDKGCNSPVPNITLAIV